MHRFRSAGTRGDQLGCRLPLRQTGRKPLGGKGRWRCGSKLVRDCRSPPLHDITTQQPTDTTDCELSIPTAALPIECADGPARALSSACRTAASRAGTALPRLPSTSRSFLPIARTSDQPSYRRTVAGGLVRALPSACCTAASRTGTALPRLPSTARSFLPIVCTSNQPSFRRTAAAQPALCARCCPAPLAV